MIIDLERFLKEEKPLWEKLDLLLLQLENDPEKDLSLEELKAFHDYYQRASADLARMATFGSDPDTRRYLESLVARAYGETQEIRGSEKGFSLLNWFLAVLPETFRRRRKAFFLALTVTIAGIAFGGLAVMMDPDAKGAIMPFQELLGSPSERVAKEEQADKDRLKGIKMRGAAWYMTHNTRVSFFTAVSGISWGTVTVINLFYNGVILGGVAADYIMDGKTIFLLAWLMPHGVVEIPAILLGGQAGFVLAGAMIGRKSRLSLRLRLKKSAPDFITICFGAAILLVWAGIIESFLSQYHQPVIPYAVKIGFGCAELGLLTLFLIRSGRKKADDEPA